MQSFYLDFYHLYKSGLYQCNDEQKINHNVNYILLMKVEFIYVGMNKLLVQVMANLLEIIIAQIIFL